MVNDAHFMARAIEIAEIGRYTARPNPLVGCVMVREGQILSEGAHEQFGGPHAEQQAIARANTSLKGATCYVTLEPCSHWGKTPPCAEALIATGIRRVVIGMRDPNPQVNGQGIAALQAAGISVTTGVLADAAAHLNPGFIKRQRLNRPFIRLKLALSLDGRTAMANGESQWITGPDARARVQHLRAISGAIITGANTAIDDQARLTVRSPAIMNALPPTATLAQPLRVLLDRRCRVPASAPIFSDEAPTLHITTPCTLTEVVQQLVQRAVNEVLVEAGPTLTGAFIAAGLVDEMILFYAPKLLGQAAKPLAFLPEKLALADHDAFKIKSVETIGEDLCLTVIKKAIP